MPMNTHCVPTHYSIPTTYMLYSWGNLKCMIKCNKFKTYDGLMPLIYYQINKLICLIVPPIFLT